jgi:peptide/nickel transport system permease protein
VLRLLGRKFLHLIPVLFLVTFAVTALPELMKLNGDGKYSSPVASILPPDATPEDLKALEHEYGYDKALPVRYVEWLGDALTGDLGESIRTKQPVMDGITERFPVTLELAILALLMALIIAVPLGVWTAAKGGSMIDKAFGSVSSALLSIPTFVSSILLVFFFANPDYMQAFPVSDWKKIDEYGLGTNLEYAFLPALALALAEIPQFHRLLRGDMLTTLQEDYILTARSKGLSTPYVLFRHALRPSSFSLITISGITLGRLIGGTVVVEMFFAIPGLGAQIVQAIQSQDIPIVQGSVVIIAVGYVLINTLVDIGYMVLDPRVRAR